MRPNDHVSNEDYQAWLQAYNARMRAWRKESYALQDQAQRVSWLTAVCICVFFVSLIVLNCYLMSVSILFTVLTALYRHALIKKSMRIDDMRSQASANRRYYDYG